MSHASPSRTKKSGSGYSSYCRLWYSLGTHPNPTQRKLDICMQSCDFNIPLGPQKCRPWCYSYYWHTLVTAKGIQLCCQTFQQLFWETQNAQARGGLGEQPTWTCCTTLLTKAEALTLRTSQRNTGFNIQHNGKNAKSAQMMCHVMVSNLLWTTQLCTCAH